MRAQRCLSEVRLPLPGRELCDVGGRVLADTLEDVDEIVVRIDVVLPTGRDQALAMAYIEERFESGQDVTEHFMRELHALAVQGLERAGDATPGAYRQGPVKISRSAHLPLEAVMVPQYMTELVSFINRPDAAKYDLKEVMPGMNEALRTYQILRCQRFKLREEQRMSEDRPAVNDQGRWLAAAHSSSADKAASRSTSMSPPSACSG